MFFFVFFLLAASSGTAAADVISGSAELTYSHFDTDTTDASGETTKTKSDSFNQRYTLNMNLALYPNVQLKAGGVFEYDDSTLKSGSLDSKTTDRTIYPFVDLTFTNPLYNLGAGYARREERQTATGAPSTTLVNEDYHAAVGWRPEGLPWITVLYTKTNTFDTTHQVEDVTSDKVSSNIRYAGIKGLDLNYQATYNKTDDKINNLQTTDLTQLARATYSDQFFNRRVSLNTSANVALETTKTSTSGQGTVLFQVFPFAGLSGLTTDTIADLQVTLDPDAALIDGNLTVSAGINIGVPPPTVVDTRRRNMGLDLFNPTDVDTLYVYLAIPPNIVNAFPNVVNANLFKWTLYTSIDNITWQRLPNVSEVTCQSSEQIITNGCAFQSSQSRFAINFSTTPPTTTRYIKITGVPLQRNELIGIPGVANPSDFGNIFVTEMQAFTSKPAGQVEGTVNRDSELYNLNVRTRILDVPSLYYDLTFFLAHTGGISSLTRYTLANTLFAFHTFSSVFTGSGSIGVENGKDVSGSRNALVYTATVRAVPFRTLSHSLVFSGRSETIGGQSTDTNSLSLTNTAELYKGINVNASVTVSAATLQTGEKDDTLSFIVGANVVPHSTMTLGINYSANRTKQSGLEAGSTTNTTDRIDMSASYRPFPTVYLFASMGVLESTGAATTTIQNYGVNWSPFPDGTLQFNFAYNQNFNSIDNSKSTLISPSITWAITTRTFLDVSYLVLKSTATSQSSDSTSYTVSLRKYF